MKKIYIILTYTGTFLSKVIKGYTKAEFAHISISLDKELTQMYSFGRLNAYNPFIGGFVHEHINQGTFKRFKNTITKVYDMDVEDEQYEAIKMAINEIEENRQLYKFNLIGLFAAGFNVRIEGKNSFYCAEFVKHVIESAGIQTGLPQIIKPENFKSLKGLKEIYKGKLRNYNLLNTSI